MRPVSIAALLTGTAAALAGCGPTCQSTCQRMYGDGPGECYVSAKQLSRVEAAQRCADACANAMNTPGDAPAFNDPRYNPSLQYTSSVSLTATLENQNHAAAWMDCVWSFEDDVCHDKLEDQFCVQIRGEN